jgi:hypothetical protein
MGEESPCYSKLNCKGISPHGSPWDPLPPNQPLDSVCWGVLAWRANTGYVHPSLGCPPSASCGWRHVTCMIIISRS